MVRAYSLYYALIVSLVMALVTSSIIFLAYAYRLEATQYEVSQKIMRNVQSGLNFLIAENEHGVPFNLKMNFIGEEKGILNLEKCGWGLFEVAVVTGKLGGKQQTESAILGTASNNYTQTALYLSDQNKPLSVAGDTRVKGDSYLPEAGVERAYISGRSYTGTRLIYGSRKKSNKQLPPLDGDVINRNKINNVLEKGDSIVSLSETDEISQQFSDPTILLSSERTIRLNNRDIQGNVIVHSHKAIYVTQGANLDDILLYAPYVKVQENVDGSFQAFAADSLKVGAGVKLQYPSCVGLISEFAGKHSPKLIIGERAKIEGSVIVIQSDNHHQSAQLKIQNGSEVKGQVWADAVVNIKGKVKGNLTCKKLRLRTRSSVYDNHLLDVVIDRVGLSPYFAWANLTQQNTQQKIAKWVDL
jgi:cytoskeletal protein CcmA (bactofilin family)